MNESPRLVRFLAGVQRRPFTSALAFHAALLIAGLAVGRSGSDESLIAYFIAATFASTAAAEILSRATSIWSLVVVVGLSTGSMVPLSMAAFTDFNWRDGYWVLQFGLVAILCAVPHLTVRLAAKVERLGSAVWMSAFAAFAAALFSAGVLIPKDAGANPARNACFFAWLVAIQLMVHAAARSAARLRLVLANAVVAGVVSGATAAIAKTHGHWVGTTPGYVLSPIVGWLVGALFVPFARIGRSFTAVPMDHAIHTDFGGPETR